MAKVVYSAYSEYNSNTSEFTPIDDYIEPYDNSSAGWTKLPYLTSGVTITRNGDVFLYRCNDIASAFLPNNTVERVGKNFVNAQNVNIINGGALYLDAGAVASGTVISGRRSTEKISYNWEFTNYNSQAEPGVRAESYEAQILSGGIQSVNGGYTCDTKVFAGGTQTVAGGTATKLVKDQNNEYYTKSSTAEGLTENTTIFEGGTQTVNQGGVAYNTKVNGGKMEVKSGTAYNTEVNDGFLSAGNGSILFDTAYSQDSDIYFASGAILKGFLFASKAITINGNVNTDELDFCFDLSAMSDKNMTVLNEDMFNNLSEGTNFYICNTISDEMVDSGENSFTYSIINIGQEFSRAISVLNVMEDIAGNKHYSTGTQLILNQQVYDSYGNSYTLKYDSETHDYSVDFVNNTISNFIEFKSGKASASAELYAAANPYCGLYSVNFDIYDPDSTLTQTERLRIYNSMSGTIKIYDNNKLIGTQTIRNGVIIGQKILVQPVEDQQLYYSIQLHNASGLEKDFTIKASMTNTSLNNIDSEDNAWQALPEKSSVFEEKNYIFKFNESGDANIFNEYVGFDDNSDYRRLDFSNAGKLSISAQLKSLNNSANPVTISVYQATGDGSRQLRVSYAYSNVTDATFKAPDIIVNPGTYYISIQAGNSSFIQYDMNAHVELFNSPQASNLDDNNVLAEHYFSDSILSTGDSVKEWVGPGDTIDCRLLNINQAGKYTMTLKKDLEENESNNSLLRLEVLEVCNGRQRLVSTQIIPAASADYTTRDFYISPVDNAQYFVRVTNINAAQGNNIDYEITFNGTTFNANNADDLPANAAEAAKISEENSYLIKDDYLGYGDLTDYYKFEITESGDYSFTLESSLRSGAYMTVYRLYDDNKLGTVPLMPTVSCAAPYTYDFKADNYYSTTAATPLLAGTYYVQISGGNSFNDTRNTEYSVKLSGSAYADFATAETIEKGKTYTITVTDGYMSLTSEDFRKFTISQDNGYNRTVNTVTAYETILAPGTYYFKAIADMTPGEDFTFAPSEKYQNAVITDNNSWKKATDITAAGVQDQWVGYGDGADYYKYTVTADNAGKTTITFSADIPNNASVTVYRVATDYSGAQYIAACPYYMRNNVIEINDLMAGDYYIAVTSRSYNIEQRALNTAYDIAIENTPYQKLSSDITEKTVLDRFEYAVIDIDGSGTFYANFSGENYQLFKNNGYGGFQYVATYNNTALLDADTVYYLRSNVADNMAAFTPTAVENNPENTPYDGKWWLGLNDASDSYEFDTFGSEGGMTLFTLNNISDTVSANTMFTVTLYQEVNGIWQRTAAGVASYNNYTKRETAANLAVSLAADSKYKIEVSTTDRGAGNCAGYFDFTQQTFEYDYSNNTFQSADVLTGEVNSVVAIRGDNVDFYELDDNKDFNFMLDTQISTGAAVRLTFYDENYSTVLIENNGRPAWNVTLNSANCDFSMAAIDEKIKFVRVDALGASVNSYTISQNSID